MASSYIAFSQASSFDNVAVASIEGHQQCIENGTLITSNPGYQELL